MFSEHTRSEFIWRDRLNLRAENHRLLAVPVGHAPASHGFEAAWRNYVKSLFCRGNIFKLSCNPDVLMYIGENRTLAGQEHREHEGEAMGRKLTIAFYEMAGGLAQPIGIMKLTLLTIAELLQQIGGVAVPPDPERPAKETEILFELSYRDLEISRWECTAESGAPHANTLSLSGEANAEVAFAAEASEHERTKMVLARCLERNGATLVGEALQTLWGLPLATLTARARPFLPAPLAADAGAAAAAGPPVGPARGRGRGRGGAGPAPPAAGPARGRGRGRGGAGRRGGRG